MTVLVRHAPAADWLEALPLGNGRLGAMVWGDPARARFGLNDSTLWSGMPGVGAERRASAESAAAARSEAARLFREGREAEAEQVLSALGATWSQAYQPVGDLLVTVPGAGPGPRELDLAAGLHRVRAAEGEHLSVVSAADEVLVHAVPLPEGADLHVDLETPQVEEHRAERPDGLDLVLRVPSDSPPTHAPGAPPVRWDEDASRIAVAVRSRREGGRALLVCAVVTSWRGLGERPDRPGAEILAEASRRAEGALARGEQELLARHAAHPLPGADDMAITLPDEGASGLLADVLALGRYLLAASSRPGLPPANLQGIWNRELTPPWSSNYTVNINLEMNHWGAALAQAPGAVGALEGYVAMLREAGRETAARLYGADGWTVHHNSDPWGYSDPVSGNPQWATWPMGGLWLERELDSLATFRGLPPHELAEQRFEARREISRFALDLLVESSTDPTKLVTFPSTSPENEWTDAHGTALALTEGGGMDRWLVRETFENLLEAARELGREDDPVVRRVSGALPRVEGPRIGADGRVLEWHADGLPEVEPHHRHVSHLSYLYPGTISDPALDAAAAATLEARGDEATGWSLVWKTCLWARLHRPDRVENLLRLFVRDAEPADAPGTERSGLYPNLFSAHPPFQIDGNLGIVAGIGEALVQSHRGEIELLPALAPVIASGSVRGLVARPGVEVSLTWADGRPSAITLRALGAGGRGTHRVRFQDRVVDVELTDARPVQVTLLKD
jgi:alpha-L-fucosidase 2